MRIFEEFWWASAMSRMDTRDAQFYVQMRSVSNVMSSGVPLPSGMDRQDGQVVVGEAGRVVAFEGGVEGGEPVSPPAGHLGQPRRVIGGLAPSALMGIHSAAADRSAVVCTVPVARACSTRIRK